MLNFYFIRDFIREPKAKRVMKLMFKYIKKQLNLYFNMQFCFCKTKNNIIILMMKLYI